MSKHKSELGCKRLIITHFGEELLNHRDEIELDMAEDGRELILWRMKHFS